MCIGFVRHAKGLHQEGCGLLREGGEPPPLEATLPWKAMQLCPRECHPIILKPVFAPRRDKYCRKTRKYYVEYEDDDESGQESQDREETTEQDQAPDGQQVCAVSEFSMPPTPLLNSDPHSRWPRDRSG